MENTQDLVNGLTSKKTVFACGCCKQLEEESARCAGVYPFFEEFVRMLDDPSSYVRTRGLTLIAANARWDEDNKIDEIIDAYLAHILDERPITSRQCIQALPLLAQYKPALREHIANALRRADPYGKYPDSMLPLVQKDIQAALRAIRELSQAE